MGLTQCVSKIAAVWGSDLGWWSGGQLSEGGDGAAAKPQLLLCPCPTSHHGLLGGAGEGPLCLHGERSSAWIRMCPKITWVSTVFVRCCYSTSAGGGERITPSFH